ncbi:hypothetical protein C1645_762521 [Glomus cerebriforme]|uniref:HCP-like protein n=1 Tax=Glomus cerebriforme TaxID=658196 RepID=A0A397T527_9GLOM|nr:hypothetical protein C1645_762521 [Glomus cerebriforme]
MPESFKILAIKAVNHDPEFRPKVTDMFEVLSKCFEELERPKPTPSQSSDSSKSQNQPSTTSRRTSSFDQNECTIPQSDEKLPDFESFKYMTLAEAQKQHKMIDRSNKLIGDVKTAYKCFEEYANPNNTIRNQIIAKYYKAYYISRGLVESPKDKDKVIAQLFKEVADDEANEFPEAKLRYGDCLYNGKGVEKNLTEALKYFEAAAANGFKVAMYNAGKLYFNGDGVKKDEEKAINYMKLAIYHEYEPAIKFCKDNDIPL